MTLTSTDDPALKAIGSQTFPLVRKGFDPEEVRAYLARVDEAVTRLRAAAAGFDQADGAPRPVPGPDGSGGPTDTVALAEADLAQLQAEQDALRAWFGEDGRAGPADVPREVSEAAARANDLISDAEAQAAEIVAAAEARADRNPASATTSSSGATSSGTETAPGAGSEPGGATIPATGRGDRWDDLGEHVARLLAHAEQEAIAMKAEAAEATAREVEAAEADRSAASDHLVQTQLLVMSMLNDAEGDAAAIRDRAEPEARDHVARIMAEAQRDLDVTRGALHDARARLTEVHTLVGRSLAEASDDQSFVDPAELVASAAAVRSPEGQGAPTGAPSTETLVADDDGAQRDVQPPDDPGGAGTATAAASAASTSDGTVAGSTASDDISSTSEAPDGGPPDAGPSGSAPIADAPIADASIADASIADASIADSLIDDADVVMIGEESALARFFDEQGPSDPARVARARRSHGSGWRARFTKDSRRHR